MQSVSPSRESEITDDMLRVEVGNDGYIEVLLGNGDGDVCSNLRIELPKPEDYPTRAEFIKDAMRIDRHNAQIDFVERLVLNHALVGIDIQSPEYSLTLAEALEAGQPK